MFCGLFAHKSNYFLFHYQSLSRTAAPTATKCKIKCFFLICKRLRWEVLNLFDINANNINLFSYLSAIELSLRGERDCSMGFQTQRESAKCRGWMRRKGDAQGYSGRLWFNWYKVCQEKIHAFMLFTPNYHPTIQMSQQKSRVIELGNLFPICYCPVLVSPCEL